MRSIVTIGAEPKPRAGVSIGFSQRAVPTVGFGVVALAASIGMLGSVSADSAELHYPKMAPLAEYRIARQAEEVALARSAAPTSISNAAEILTLGSRGYETAVQGKNGFTCIVERSWASNFDDTEYWNPKIRAPICFNPAATRSVLPTYLKQTEWLLAGASKSQILERTRSAVAAKSITPPETGSMCYMMSKDGYLSDVAGGHWHPHLMFFLPSTPAATWGANLPGTPMFASDGGVEPVTVFFAPVPNWSDGSPGPATRM
jgi:hypothetical protein